MSELLLQAIRDKHSPDEISQLIAEGADVNYQNDDGMTALMEATLDLNLPMMTRLLVEHHAEVDREDSEGQTALNHVYLEYVAGVEAPLLPIINLLLTHQANPNHTDRHGATLFQWAVFNGYINIADRLLREGVDPASAIDDAYEVDNQPMIKLLESYLNSNEGSELDDAPKLTHSSETDDSDPELGERIIVPQFR